MRPHPATARPVRTQADKKAEAMRFVWEAGDRAIRATKAETLAAMKGVTKASDIADIREALAQRIARTESPL